MNKEQKNARRNELAKQIAFANALGVRAELCNDDAQRAEAKRLYDEAKAELAELSGEPK